jgi:hypothetical protein
MLDQDRQTGRVGEPSGSEGLASLTVPGRAVDWLRRGAFAQIGSAAEAIDEVAFADGREAHPEWFRAPMDNLRETYALLDAIGWSRTVPPVDVRVDLRRDGWVLMRVLHETLKFADADADESTCGDVDRSGCNGQSLLDQREEATECAGLLCELIAVATAHIDALAIEEGSCSDGPPSDAELEMAAAVGFSEQVWF